MYAVADRYIRLYDKRFINLFGQLTATLHIDELNVLNSVQTLYAELDRLTRQALLLIAEESYDKCVEQHVGLSGETEIDELFLIELLIAYNPVTKYMFTNEVDRKRARLAEAILSDLNTADKEVKQALKLWSGMFAQYAITVTDEAALKAYKDSGYTHVLWVSMLDDRRCEVCEERDGAVYPIDDVPPKPHWGCRCQLLPWPDKEPV